jgi:uncharacterized membrane protein YczE
VKPTLAIYDMDKTITRRATFTPFLIHAALGLAPWRLLLVPLVLMTASPTSCGWWTGAD